MVDVFNLFDAANFGQNMFDHVRDSERFGTPINIITPPEPRRSECACSSDMAASCRRPSSSAPPVPDRL
jgi:hypothetical protein